MQVYLDYAAAAVPNPHIVSELPRLASIYANASSRHSAGHHARGMIENARHRIADCLGADDDEIFFCSSATQAANIILRGIQNRDTYYSAIEHECVSNTAEDVFRAQRIGSLLGCIPVNSDGLITAEQLDEYLGGVYAGHATVAIQHVNNETGVIQPIKDLTAVAHSYNSFMVCDISQSIGHMPIDLHDLGVDFAFASTYKYSGIKGCGVIYKRGGIDLQSIQTGGGQERYLVSGTENLAAIVASADALELSLAKLGAVTDRITHFREQIIDCVRAIPGNRINSPADGAPQILNVGFTGLSSEVLVMLLDNVGICVSGKSACGGDDIEPSHVLRAMNVPDDFLYGSIRISMGAYTSQADIDYFCEQLPICVKKARDI